MKKKETLTPSVGYSSKLDTATHIKVNMDVNKNFYITTRRLMHAQEWKSCTRSGKIVSRIIMGRFIWENKIGYRHKAMICIMKMVHDLLTYKDYNFEKAFNLTIDIPQNE